VPDSRPRYVLERRLQCRCLNVGPLTTGSIACQVVTQIEWRPAVLSRPPTELIAQGQFTRTSGHGFLLRTGVESSSTTSRAFATTPDSVLTANPVQRE